MHVVTLVNFSQVRRVIAKSHLQVLKLCTKKNVCLRLVLVVTKISTHLNVN
jgi:hypothetical protein